MNSSAMTQYLTFDLLGEMYGVEILKVKEIRGWEEIRDIPNTPDYIKGALNLRGEIIPIVDLRVRFMMGEVTYTPITIIIILAVQTDTGETVIGIVADAVSDVLDISRDDIQEKPNLGSKIDMQFMLGLSVTADNMVMLLDVDKVLNPNYFEGLPSILS